MDGARSGWRWCCSASGVAGGYAVAHRYQRRAGDGRRARRPSPAVSTVRAQSTRCGPSSPTPTDPPLRPRPELTSGLRSASRRRQLGLRRAPAAGSRTHRRTATTWNSAGEPATTRLNTYILRVEADRRATRPRRRWPARSSRPCRSGYDDVEIWARSRTSSSATASRTPSRDLRFDTVPPRDDGERSGATDDASRCRSSVTGRRSTRTGSTTCSRTAGLAEQRRGAVVP